MLEKHPDFVVKNAVKGMLPHTKLGNKQILNLKIYTGSEHPHAAQQPKVFELPTYC
jgi:large subunit ribosomal protein L13